MASGSPRPTRTRSCRIRRRRSCSRPRTRRRRDADGARDGHPPEAAERVPARRAELSAVTGDKARRRRAVPARHADVGQPRCAASIATTADDRTSPASASRSIRRSARWSAMMRGDVDARHARPTRSSAKVAQRPHRLPALVVALTFNMAHTRLGRREVRRALNEAIARARVIDTVAGGRGVPAVDHIWPNHWARDADAPTFAFDLAAARAALDAAGLRRRTGPGLASRFSFTCLVQSDRRGLAPMRASCRRRRRHGSGGALRSPATGQQRQIRRLPRRAHRHGLSFTYVRAPSPAIILQATPAPMRCSTGCAWRGPTTICASRPRPPAHDARRSAGRVPTGGRPAAP